VDFCTGKFLADTFARNSAENGATLSIPLFRGEMYSHCGGFKYFLTACAAGLDRVGKSTAYPKGWVPTHPHVGEACVSLKISNMADIFSNSNHKGRINLRKLLIVH